MKILVTNDDGIESPGIQALADAIQRGQEVEGLGARAVRSVSTFATSMRRWREVLEVSHACLLYTSDAADE